MKPQSLEDIDQLLNELEMLARSDMETSEFLQALVQRARATLNASQCALVVSTNLNANDHPWLPIASYPRGAELHSRTQTDLLATITPGEQELSLPMQHDVESVDFLAAPLEHQHPERGTFVAEFADLNRADIGQCERLQQLTLAFAEIAGLRRETDLSAIQNQWSILANTIADFSSCEDLEECDLRLVNGVAQVSDAARVSLVCPSSKTLLAVSNVSKLDRKSVVTAALLSAADRVLEQGYVLERTGSGGPRDHWEGDTLSANLIGLTVTAKAESEPSTSSSAPQVLLCEFRCPNAVSRGLSTLPDMLPPLQAAWHQSRRWLSVPATLRERLNRKPQKRQRARIVSVVGILILFALAWVPLPLRIEATGIYEPLESRSVFAPFDGFVESLNVIDGSDVDAKHTLGQLSAPELQREIVRLRGESSAATEKIASLRIAMNQLSSGRSDVLLEQSRIAAEIKELEALVEGLDAQLALLQKQSESLQLRAPVGGQIIAEDLEERFLGRPVKRGELIMKVADTGGAWHLRLRIPDRDLGYLTRHFSPNEDASSFDFVFDSSPSDQWKAKVVAFADQMQMAHDLSGSFLEINAVSLDAHRDIRPGAGVTATFRCGTQPAWFVWSRPLVEALQRRMIL